jgi:starch synthase
VGGLRDTVIDGMSGFVFDGASPVLQADALVDTLRRALVMRGKKTSWNKIRRGALAARFPWESSARAYVDQLYSAPRNAPERDAA